MIEKGLYLRVVENKDWATILFLIAFITIAITKSAFENRFAEFARLIYSDKYNNIYKDSSNLKSGFTISLFFVQILSLSFFIHLSLHYLKHYSKTDWTLYIQITTFLVYFIFSRFLLDKIIATAFGIEEIVEQFNLQKVVSRTYIGLILLPIDLFLYYNDGLLKNFVSTIILIVLIINILTYLIAIKNYRTIIFSKFLYFILYLCALEIAPYYFIYYWFTKGIG